MKKIKICFAFLEGSPDYLGGANIFHKNLINYIYSKNKNILLFWVYFGNENKKYIKDNVEYIELKSGRFNSPLLLKRSIILSRFFKKNHFNVINTAWGIWTNLYYKRKNQRIIHTFHGTMYYFNKNHLKNLNLLNKILLLPLLGISWIVDKPNKNTDKLICVSEKVKRQVEKLYGKKKNLVVIRTGVNLYDFKPRDKNRIKKELKLEENKIYGLYVGGGGFWTKGLDRTTKLSEEIYNMNPDYRLIVIGPDYDKVKHLLDKKFIIFLQNVPRKNIPYYYSTSDIFFCLSRYEGGAPTLVVSEAMASGCLLVCSKDSEQEIIDNNKNGLIIEDFNKNDAEKIIKILEDKRKKENLIKNSIKTVEELSLEKWGEIYLKELLK